MLPALDRNTTTCIVFATLFTTNNLCIFGISDQPISPYSQSYGEIFDSNGYTGTFINTITNSTNATITERISALTDGVQMSQLLYVCPKIGFTANEYRKQVNRKSYKTGIFGKLRHCVICLFRK